MQHPIWVYTVCLCPIASSDLGLHCLPMCHSIIWSGSTLFAYVPLQHLIWVYTVCPVQLQHLILVYTVCLCPNAASDLGLHRLPLSHCSIWSGSTLFAYVPLQHLIWVFTICLCPTAASDLGLHCLPMSQCGIWSGSTPFACIPLLHLIWVYTVCLCPIYGILCMKGLKQNVLMICILTSVFSAELLYEPPHEKTCLWG